MNIEIGRHAGIDLFEEVEKFGSPVPLIAFADDEARSGVEAANKDVVP
jgi:hypothetical protein